MEPETFNFGKKDNGKKLSDGLGDLETGSKKPLLHSTRIGNKTGRRRIIVRGRKAMVGYGQDDNHQVPRERPQETRTLDHDK